MKTNAWIPSLVFCGGNGMLIIEQFHDSHYQLRKRERNQHQLTMKTVFFLLSIGLILSCADVCRGALVISTFNTAHIVDFDSTVSDVNNGAYTGAGFSPSPGGGALDSDSWASTGMSDGSLGFGGTSTTGDFARGSSTGGETIGGFYGFEIGALDRALGIQPTAADFTPGTITLRIQNTTGSTIDSLDIAYVAFVFNDEDMANSFNFSYSPDDSTYTPVPALNVTSTAAADAVPSWVGNIRSTSLTGLNIANDGFFYLRWSGADVSGTGSRDEFGLDDISITAVPEPTNIALGIFAFGLLVSSTRTWLNSRRARLRS